MKKWNLLSLAILISASAVSKTEPYFYGSVNGSITDYYNDKIKIEKTINYYKSATTGVDGAVASLNQKMALELMDMATIEGKKFCSGFDGYAIDNTEISSQIYGTFNNNLVTLKANIVCYSLK
ncbi:hypothetical protein NMS56_001106 [Vibrio cholerae]|nr:hypothetical protein [Vibrio cholerae]EJL6662914.1 hypothetical protein [Vibrio cholerae]